MIASSRFVLQTMPAQLCIPLIQLVASTFQPLFVFQEWPHLQKRILNS